MGRVVMVTGVSRYLGGRFTQLLQADPDISRVIGVDVVPPKADLGDAEFVRADIRNPVIGKVIAQAEVDTVVHMAVLSTPLDAGGRATMKEINVIGTMQLLAACQKAPSVRKLVVKSSTAVYGSSPRDPAMFTEDLEPNALARSGYAKDSVEVEGYVRGFARRRPDVAVTTLRFANFVGPKVRTPLTQYFSLPVVPTVLGFDPRMQFVHERDGLEVLWRATLGDHGGTFNIAGDGVMLLSQAIRRAGRPSVPLPQPAAPWIGGVLKRLGVADFSPEQMRFLAYGRVVDTSRMRDVLGFEPRYSTREAFDEVTLVVDPSRIVEACLHLRDELGFNVLSDIAPADYLGWGEQPVSGYVGTASGRDLNDPSTQGLSRLPAPKPKRFSVSYHLLRVADDPTRVRYRIGSCAGPIWTGPGTNASGFIRLGNDIQASGDNVVFTYIGTATTTGTYTVTNPRDGKTLTVVVTAAGRISIEP